MCMWVQVPPFATELFLHPRHLLSNSEGCGPSSLEELLWRRGSLLRCGARKASHCGAKHSLLRTASDEASAEREKLRARIRNPRNPPKDSFLRDYTREAQRLEEYCVTCLICTPLKVTCLQANMTLC